MVGYDLLTDLSDGSALQNLACPLADHGEFDSGAQDNVRFTHNVDTSVHFPLFIVGIDAEFDCSSA